MGALAIRGLPWPFLPVCITFSLPGVIQTGSPVWRGGTATPGHRPGDRVGVRSAGFSPYLEPRIFLTTLGDLGIMPSGA